MSSQEKRIYFGDELDVFPKQTEGFGLGYESEPDDDTMQQEGPPRKKRKKKHLLLKFLITVATIASLYLVATSPLFEIRGIEVEGIDHFTSIEIIDRSGIKTGDNLWRVKIKEAIKNLEESSYIKNAEVKRILPTRISIVITERKPYFAAFTGDTYIVSDVEGFVLYTGKEAPSLPIIENLEAEGEAGEEIQVKQKTLLDDTIALLTATEKEGFFVSRIVITDINVQVYLDQGLKCKGSFSDITGNMTGIRGVVNDLTSKGILTGTLIVSGNGTCTYSPDENA